MEKEKSAEVDEALPGGDDGVVATQKCGTLFIEARIRDEAEEEMDIEKIRGRLEEQLSSPNQVYKLFTDLLVDEFSARLLLGTTYDYTKDLQSLKVVEYSGPVTEIDSHCSSNVHVKVQVYQLYHTRRSTEEHEGLPQADVMPLPHIKFDGQWDELFFENDVKGDLIWMMTNILRFSQASGREPGDTSPLILFYGPPGTGKTTLCQGLAQKISIRLNTVYKRTSLIQIKAAALLSKYYSESAKQVDKIFSSLQQMCEGDPEEFICVIIDEVETIAITREASAHGESQESLRATNAFLTGLDRTKRFPNIVFLCTSNMVKSLDAAFLDRCGLKIAVDPPTKASQYAILRGQIQKLITRGIVHSHVMLPSYRDAEIDRDDDPELPGSRVLHILELINSSRSKHSEAAISGRLLTQLPELALLRYLRGEHCDLNKALGLIEQYVQAEQAGTNPAKIEEEDPHSAVVLKGANDLVKIAPDVDQPKIILKGLELGGRKRNASTASKEDHVIEQALAVLGDCLGAMGELVAGLRKREETGHLSSDDVESIA